MANFMKRNVGSTDQVVRFLVGAGFISMYFLAGTQAMQWTGLVIGTVLLLTVLFSFCPVYAMFGLSTRGQAKGVGKTGKSEIEKVAKFSSRSETEKARADAVKAATEKDKEKEKDEHKTAA